MKFTNSKGGVDALNDAKFDKKYVSNHKISVDEIDQYGHQTCNRNAYILANKFKKLNPIILIGYRNRVLPEEKEMGQPHVCVYVKGKVWECGMIMTKEEEKEKHYKNILVNGDKEELYHKHRLEYIVTDFYYYVKITGFEIKYQLDDPKLWEMILPIK